MKKALMISNVARKFTTYMKTITEVLQSLGYEVHICSNYSKYIGYKEDEKKYNVKLHHIDFERNPLNFNNYKAYKELKNLMQKEKFDLVHCNTPIGGLLGRICAKKLDVPQIIYTAHGFHFYKGAPFLNNTVYKKVEKILAKYTDVIITINKEDYEAAKKFKLRKEGKVFLVHGVGIDFDDLDIKNFNKTEYRKKLKLQEDDIVVLSIGELNKNKNHETVIKAIKQSNNKKMHLLICGEGKREEKIKSIIKKYDLEKNVHLLGYRNDIPQLLLSSDIFISMSHREGLSRAIMEAMFEKLPCIVSRN